MADARSPRSSLAITLNVWKALFLRDVANRISRERLGSLWLVVEPMVHIVVIIILFETLRVRVVGGIATSLWLMIGMTLFFLYRRVAQQTMYSIGANQALYTYRQVKPIDAVLVRAGVEGVLMMLVTIILFGAAGLYGLDIVPDDPLAVLQAFFGMWLIGLGFGLTASVISEMLPEMGQFLSMTTLPLFFLSGVIFPIGKMPHPYQEWFLLNPLAHGLEGARQGYATYYQGVAELNMAYLYVCALALVFFGLLLHKRFATRLAAR